MFDDQVLELVRDLTPEKLVTLNPQELKIVHDYFSSLEGSFIPQPRQRVAIDLFFKDQVDELLFGGAAGGGKALELHTPIPTPSGWTTMGELKVGDELFDDEGKICHVVKVHPVQYNRPCYNVVFDDGSSIIADENHLWVTSTIVEAVPIIRTTLQILETFKYQHLIKLPASVVISDREWKYLDENVKILAVEPVPSVPVRCIEVSSPNKMFLAGQGMIPTHNSWTLVHIAIEVCERFPGANVLILRRIYPSLERTIIKSLHRILGGDKFRANWNANRRTWYFPNGSTLECSSLQFEESVLSFSGAEYALIIFEELAEFSRDQYEFMLSRLRTTVPGLKPRVIASANPVGQGAKWVRERWIMPPPQVVPNETLTKKAKTSQPWTQFGSWKNRVQRDTKVVVCPDVPWVQLPTDEMPHPLRRAFVPSRVEDNKALLMNDPGYLQRLESIRDPKARRALRSGDWEAMDEADGALWDELGLEVTRVVNSPPLYDVVIGVDPSGSERGDEVGLVAGGLDLEFPLQHLFVVADRSGHMSPFEWPIVAINLYDEIGADGMIVETNYGGDMAVALIQNIRPTIPVHKVNASRGKRVRAEPIAGLWYTPAAQGGPRAHMVGHFTEMEEELTSWTPDSDVSPGRLDALVWMATWLTEEAGGPVEVHGKALAERRIPGR